MSKVKYSAKDPSDWEADASMRSRWQTWKSRRPVSQAGGRLCWMTGILAYGDGRTRVALELIGVWTLYMYIWWLEWQIPPHRFMSGRSLRKWNSVGRSTSLRWVLKVCSLLLLPVLCHAASCTWMQLPAPVSRPTCCCILLAMIDSSHFSGLISQNKVFFLLVMHFINQSEVSQQLPSKRRVRIHGGGMGV